MDGKQLGEEILKEVGKFVIGKEDVTKKVLCAILAGGHILIEDIPGLGKTTLAMTLAKIMNLEAKRMQFTPDVLPSDITGFNMYDEASQAMVFKPGVIFCNIFLADEINRTSPKSQSALLEVMEERKITMEGVAYELPRPFMVIATQNPSGAAGTQLLPDSEMDRFMIRLSMGYPAFSDEIDIIKQKRSEAEEPNTVLDAEKLMQMMIEVENIYIHDKIYEYIVSLVTATRNDEYIKQGGSPRAGISLAKMAAAHAFLEGRKYCVPSDVQKVFKEVLIHRINLNTAAKGNELSKEEILDNILKRVEPPRVSRK